MWQFGMRDVGSNDAEGRRRQGPRAGVGSSFIECIVGNPQRKAPGLSTRGSRLKRHPVVSESNRIVPPDARMAQPRWRRGVQLPPKSFSSGFGVQPFRRHSLERR